MVSDAKPGIPSSASGLLRFREVLASNAGLWNASSSGGINSSTWFVVSGKEGRRSLPEDLRRCPFLTAVGRLGRPESRS